MTNILKAAGIAEAKNTLGLNWTPLILRSKVFSQQTLVSAMGGKRTLAIIVHSCAHGWMVMKLPIAIFGLALLVLGCENPKVYEDGCGPPPKGWITPREGRGVLSILNVVLVAANRSIVWNGVAVSEQEFERYLELSRNLQPVPVTQIKFAPNVDCEKVARFRAIVNEKLDCTDGLCAEGSGKWWMRGDVIFEGVPSKPYDPDAPSPEDRVSNSE